MSDVEKNIGTHKPEFAGEWVRLGDVIKKAKSARRGSDSYPILSITMRDGIVEQASRFKKSIASRDTGNYKVVEPGQLVVGFPIDEGVIYVQNFNYPGIMSPAYDVWDIDSSRVDPSYLELALHSPQSMDYYRSNLRGTTARRRSLPTNTLCDLTFPLPSLENQRIVVKRMSMIATLLDDAGSRLSALDDLVKSQFVEMFGGNRTVVPMGRLVSSIISGTNVGGQQRPLSNGEYGVLKISSVTKGVFLPNEFKVVDDVTGVKMIHPRKGDLLFSRANTSEMVGATAIVDRDYDRLFLPDKLWRLEPAEGVEAVFLKALLSSPSVRSEMSRISTGSSGSMQNISMAKFKKLSAFLPPVELQRQFADFVAKVDKLGFDVQQQIEKLETLKRSLMQEYFG